MIWAGIFHNGKTELISVAGNLTSHKHCDEIIEPVVVPIMRQHDVTLFRQDNACPHTARYTQDALRRNNVQVLSWPARSPDISPIEHPWDHVGRQARDKHDVENVRDLAHALQQEWARIPLRVIRKLICSMRRRCGAVVAAGGRLTRY